MKIVTKILFSSLLFLSFLFGSYYCFFAIKINFRNHTGVNITNLKIGKKEIGTLKNGTETGYIRFLSFKFDGSIPDEKITATCDSKSITKSNSDYNFCGTFKHIEYFGEYQMDIKVIKNDNKIELLSLATINK